MATLHVYLPGSGVVTHELSGKTPASIGGASENAIAIQDPSVSQHHAEITCEGETYRLRDLGSANKSWLNGVAVAAAPIHDGDSIRFGAVETIFRLQSSPAKMAAEATPRGRLVLHIPGQAGEAVFRCEGPLVRVGWKSDNDIPLNDPSVSGHHAQLLLVGGKYRLKDLNSTNKTFLNGHTIIEAELQDGDRVQFGAVSGVFKVEYRVETLPPSPEADAAAKALASRIQEQQTKIDALLKDQENLRLHNQQLSKQLEEATAQLEKTAAAACEKSEALARELNAKIEAEAARASASEQELKSARETGEQTARHLREAQERIENLSGDQSSAQQKTAELASARDAARQESERLAGDLAQARASLDTLASERDAERRKGVELSQKLAEAEGHLLALQRKVHEAEEKCASTVAEVKAAAAAEWEAKCEVERQRAAALEAAQVEAKARIDTLTQERDTLTQERDTLTQERDTLLAASQKPVAPAPQPSEALRAVKLPAPSEPATPLPKAPVLSLLRDDAPAPTTASEAAPKASLIQIAKPLLPTVPAATPPPRLKNSTTIKLDVNGDLLKTLIATAPETLNEMRRCLHAFIKNQAQTELLDELLARLHELTRQTSGANLTAVCTLSLSLEALIEDLTKIPGQINPSSLRTVSQSIDFLVTLLDEKNLFRTREPYSANIIAVDDDADARKTIRGAIEAVNLRTICAEDSKTTLAALGEKKFDLIFIDVGLPDMNGFELCTRLRKLPDYKKTPVVFITGAVTVQNRVQSSLSGGNDFIAKPFNLLELGVKALIWIFKSQLGLV